MLLLLLLFHFNLLHVILLITPCTCVSFVGKSSIETCSNNGVDSIWIAVAYAGGYATGTLLGTFISNRFINTLISVEVITTKATPENIEKIFNEEIKNKV